MMFATESRTDSKGSAARADREIVIVKARPGFASTWPAAFDSSIHCIWPPSGDRKDGLAVVHQVCLPELPKEVGGADEHTDGD